MDDIKSNINEREEEESKKKEWRAPTLKILNQKMTAGGFTGPAHEDGTYYI